MTTTNDYSTLRRQVLNRIYNDVSLWEKCWPLTDAYGEPGFEPPQGLDWSGFRDSSDEAIIAMARLLKMQVRKTSTTVAMADAVAEVTADAYSWDEYNEAGWRSCCRMLAKRGYNALEIEAIMRSKWTRWAVDHATFHVKRADGRHNSADLARFIDDTYPNVARRAEEVRSLVIGTFGFDALDPEVADAFSVYGCNVCGAEHLTRSGTCAACRGAREVLERVGAQR